MQTVHTDEDSNDSTTSQTSEAHSQDSGVSVIDADLLEYVKGLLLAANDKHIEIKKVGLLDLIEQYETEQESDEPPTKQSRHAESEAESESSQQSMDSTECIEIEDFTLDEDQVSFILSLINLAMDNKICLNKTTLVEMIDSLQESTDEQATEEN